MDIQDFLIHNVENYLFKDLKQIAKVKPNVGEHAGAASYPMLASIMAGIELLGALVNPDNAVVTVSGKSKIEGDKHFVHFWLHYLSEQDKKYKGFDKLFYDLLRNGIAHTFTVKHYIHVYKSNKNHMWCDKSKPLLIVGCIQFFEDLKTTYESLVKPILESGTTKTNVDRAKMQSNLDELLSLYEGEALIQFTQLNIPTKTPPFMVSTMPISGPSLSTVKYEDIKEFITASGINLTRKTQK